MSKSFPYYPIFLDIEDRLIVLAGGGEVCVRKVETLLRYGARIRVVSPVTHPDIDAWATAGTIEVRRKRYEASDLEGAALVIASTDDASVNAQVAQDCRRLGVPVNVADATHLCDFIAPAVVERGSMQIAVSTGGRSPALARALRRDLERFADSGYAELSDVLGSLRSSAQETLAEDSDRRLFFDAIIGDGVVEMLRTGARRQAWEAIARRCDEAGVPRSERLGRLLDETAEA